jgi:hypothetical protein
MVFRARRPVPLRGLLLATALLLSCSQAGAQQEPLPVAGVDVYGTDAFDADEVRAVLEPDVRRYVATTEQLRLDGESDALIGTLREIDAKLRAAFEARVPLADFEISPITSFQPTQRIYVTIDVVTRTDAARRMPFRRAPEETFDDPDGLVALWQSYQSKVFELARAGVSLKIDAGQCPALHCLAPFERPELKPYLARFDAGARRNEERLYAIAARSGDKRQRATAIFLLAHANDAARLLPVLGRAIFDPDEGVRNNAMRVLIYVAREHPELDFPVHDLIAAMDFPGTSDRNKASYVVDALADQPRYRDTIRAEAVPTALRLLKLTQPNNHEPAYEILTKLSGEQYGERDYAAWQRWAEKTR